MHQVVPSKVLLTLKKHLQLDASVRIMTTRMIMVEDTETIALIEFILVLLLMNQFLTILLEPPEDIKIINKFPRFAHYREEVRGYWQKTSSICVVLI